MNRKIFLLASFLIALGFAVAGNQVRNGMRESKEFGRVVSVRGLAEKTVESNEATWSLQFTITNADLMHLNSRVREVQKVVQTFVEEQGFSGLEIEKEPVQITDRAADSYQVKEVKERYVARGGFNITSSKVKELAAASVRTEDLMKRGVVLTSSNLRYYFTLLNSIKPQMIQEATANAKNAAESFATDTKSNLGKIRNASQGLFSIGAPHSDYDSGGSFLKKVRVVTSVDFFLD